LKLACGYFAFMRPMSHHWQAGVAHVRWALAEPLFDIPEWRRPTMRPRPSKIREPESPWAENAPAFCLRI
jgi:hypothetical protein